MNEVCRRKALELRNAEPGIVRTIKAELLRDYFGKRKRELTNQFATIRGAQEALAALL
jgi:hypothetical protein